MPPFPPKSPSPKSRAHAQRAANPTAPFVEDLAPRLASAVARAITNDDRLRENDHLAFSVNISSVCTSMRGAFCLRTKRLLRILVGDDREFVLFRGPTSEWNLDERRLSRVGVVWIHDWPAVHFGGLSRAVVGSGARASVTRIVLHECPSLANLAGLDQFPVLQSVELDGCPSLVALGPLEGVPRVSIRRCPAVDSVAALARAESVDLWDLPQPLDLGPLAEVRRLHVNGLERLRALPALAKTERLTLANLPQLTELPALPRSVRSLVVDSCLRITRLPLLNHVFEVELLNLGNLDGNLAPLAGVHTVRINGLPLVEDVSPLAGARTVFITGCAQIADLSPLNAAEWAEVWDCPNAYCVPPPPPHVWIHSS